MKMNTNKPQEPIVPLSVVYDNAKKEIFSCINSLIERHQMPLFLYETILTEALHQIQGGAATERNTALALYDKQLAEYNARMENES